MNELNLNQWDNLTAHMQAITGNVINPGVMFKTGNDKEHVYTVIDILTTYNLKKEIVKTEYLCTHTFLGQNVKSRHGKTEILRGLLSTVKAISYLKNND